MADSDPEHWLHRLTSDEWLKAARNELARSEAALRLKQQRAGVAGARRAAGMAWNAVLVLHFDARYGRSYIDHLRALAVEESVPEEVRRAAQALVAAPLDVTLVTLGRGDIQLADSARVIVHHSEMLVQPSVTA
jgi:hypothetical protein